MQKTSANRSYIDDAENQNYKGVWNEWITVIIRKYRENDKKDAAVSNILKHIDECLKLDASIIRNSHAVFVEKFASMINLFYIYASLEDYQVDLERSDATKIDDIDFFSSMRKLKKEIENIKASGDKKHLKHFNDILLGISKKYDVYINYKQMIDRLQNYERKENSPFVVKRNGDVSTN